MGNVLVKKNSLVELCDHGQAWDSCVNARCQEIWRLYQQAIKEEQREEKEWVSTQRSKKRRGNKKSAYEIALDQTPAPKGEHPETERSDDTNQAAEPARARKIFRELFPDEITLRAAVQFDAVTLRQAELLRAYLDSDEGLPRYKRWDVIGRKIGCSGKSVEREFRKLVERFFVEQGSETETRTSAIKAVRVRGERKPRFYRRHCVQFGEWKREWSELIIDPKIIRDLSRDPRTSTPSERIPIRSSPVSQLFGELIRALSTSPPDAEMMPPNSVNAADWSFNLRRARRILSRKEKTTGPWTASEVARKLARGSRLCKSCRTYLLRGFRINGRPITRSREFCDNACKMRAERQKVNREK